MSGPGNVPGLMIGSVRQMAVARVNTDEAKTNLPVAAGCRSPARTFLMPRLVGPAVRPGELATDLQGVLDRSVLDQTGLGSKRFDFVLKWSDVGAMNGATGAPPSVDTPDAPPDIFTAIQQQLGLTLKSTKAQVDVIVIDYIEKPDEN